MLHQLPRGVAARLAVVFGALSILTLVPLVVASVMITNRWTETALDGHLRTAAADLVERLQQEGVDPERVVAQLSAPSQLIEIRAASHQAIIRSPALEQQAMQFSTTLVDPDEVTFQTGAIGRGRVRIILQPLPPNPYGHGYAVIATPLPDLAQQTRALASLLLGIGGAALALSLAGTWLAARWLTGPLRDLAESVRNEDAETAAEIAVAARASAEVRAVAEAIQQLSARHQARLERERAFFADSSHVLRTPLAVLQGNIDLLESATTETEREDAVGQARSAVRSIARTVSGLLLLSRREPGVTERDVVDLSALLRVLCDEFSHAWPAHLLECEIEDGIAVIGDEHSLREAIEAITENAFRYTLPARHIWIRCTRESGYAAIEVRDEGIGLSPDEARRASERFFRGYQARLMAPDGSGLGLAIADRIVQMHGGDLALTPAAGGSGTVVRIELPLFEDAATEVSEP